jgi:single-strand DNA-binding protein
MNGYTRVIVVGNVTRDPESRHTPKGTAVCDLSIAVNRKWRTEAGEVQEECSFVDCTAFGKTAETLCQYMRKGVPILIEGRLKQESWEDKQTHQNRSKLKVMIEHFVFLPDGK